MLVRPSRAVMGTLAAAAVLAGAACSSVTATEGISGRSLLFIGNSLTYVNDLPAMVAKVAEAAHDSVRVAMVAGPNLAVIDHVNGATDAVAQIGRGGWSFVVLQQGPTPADIPVESLANIPAAPLTPAQVRVLAAAAHTASESWPADSPAPVPVDTTKPSAGGGPC